MDLSTDRTPGNYWAQQGTAGNGQRWFDNELDRRSRRIKALYVLELEQVQENNHTAASGTASQRMREQHEYDVLSFSIIRGDWE